MTCFNKSLSEWPPMKPRWPHVTWTEMPWKSEDYLSYLQRPLEAQTVTWNYTIFDRVAVGQASRRCVVSCIGAFHRWWCLCSSKIWQASYKKWTKFHLFVKTWGSITLLIFVILTWNIAIYFYILFVSFMKLVFTHGVPSWITPNVIL